MNKRSYRYRQPAWGAALLAGLALAAPAWAHDPVFGLGPHVLYKGGVEVAPQFHSDKRGRARERELDLELTYGLTGDWAAGIELPYAFRRQGDADSTGFGDLSLFTKYRFLRHDTVGAQETAAVLAKLEFASGDERETPPAGSGGTDAVVGLSYGYESRKWYRWASIRYRRNGENDAGLRRGDRILLDLVGGIRPTPSGYLEPDTVWLLELNGDYGRRSQFKGERLADSGGIEWFVSPGIFWTYRYFAVKAGVQIPVASDLHGRQDSTDYRARLTLEWHL